MVDSPETLRTICLKTFVVLLRSDQQIWRNYLQENLDLPSPIDQPKRKQHRGESFSQSSSTNVLLLQRKDRSLFLDYFLRAYCPLNALLSDRLLTTLFQYDQLNDFTLRLFSGHVTCLKRLIIPIKSITRLSFDLLHQHPNLTELEIVFKDSTSICPSNYSNFNDILDVYGSNVTRRRASSICPDESSSISEEFHDQKVLHGILTHLHPMTIERLKSLSLANYKFFSGSALTPARKQSSADMSPLIKCAPGNVLSSFKSIGSNTTCIRCLIEVICSIVQRRILRPDKVVVSPTTMNSMPNNLRLMMKLKNLTTLNLSSTDVQNPSFDILLDTLTNLENLDLSSCYGISSFNSLLKLSSKLKWLNLSNCPLHLQTNPSIYHILYQLQRLEYLDISRDPSSNSVGRIDPNSEINLFLRQFYCLPCLKQFDLSGHNNVSSSSLQTFLIHHRPLQFLGLFLTEEKYLSCFHDPTDSTYSKTRRYTYDLEHLLNTTISEEHLHLYQPVLLEGLNRYEHRPIFVQKILQYIFYLCRSFPVKDLNPLLDAILHVMSLHPHHQPVQMASSACLFHLTRAPINEQIPLKRLSRVVNLIKQAMALYPDHQQLQKNCLLTLCSDRILHEPHFDFYRLATLVMRTLQNYTDSTIVQPAVAILSLLTTRLTIDECTQLGSVSNIKRLLYLIERQIDRLQLAQDPMHEMDVHHHHHHHHHSDHLTSDDTLRFSLSLLWNLTDENPMVGEVFIHSMGLQLYQRLSTLFATDNIILTKIVGLFSNIAEVSHLKIHLYSIEIIPLIQRYLTESIIDVSFSSAAILCHLLIEQTDDQIDWDLCEQMREVILSWKNPHQNIVTYRSFKPFLPLLFSTRIPVVQLWAIWAIFHVLSTDRMRYVDIVREEKLEDVIQTLYHSQITSDRTDQAQLDLLNSLLHLLQSSFQSNRSEDRLSNNSE